MSRNGKISSSQAAWALLTGAVAEARVEAHRLRHLINRGQKIVNGQDKAKKAAIYEQAGDLIDAVPSRLGKLERTLDKLSYALSEMGSEFFESRLSLDDKTEVQEAVKYTSHPFQKSINRVAGRFIEARRVSGKEIKRGDELKALFTRKYSAYNGLGKQHRIPKGTLLTVSAIGTGSGPDNVVAFSNRGDITISPWELDEFKIIPWDGKPKRS
jgi:hypothetical protein